VLLSHTQIYCWYLLVKAQADFPNATQAPFASGMRSLRLSAAALLTEGQEVCFSIREAVSRFVQAQSLPTCYLRQPGEWPNRSGIILRQGNCIRTSRRTTAGQPPGTALVSSTSTMRHQEVCFSVKIVYAFNRIRVTLPYLRELKKYRTSLGTRARSGRNHSNDWWPDNWARYFLAAYAQAVSPVTSSALAVA
jgi:hypothetical protein